MKTLAVLALMIGATSAIAESALPPVLTFPDAVKTCSDGTFCKGKQR